MAVVVDVSGARMSYRFTEDGAGSMRSGNVLFRQNQDHDWLLMREYPHADFTTKVPWERRILFLREPPMIERYGLGYVKKFGVLVCPYAIEGYPGRMILDNPCIGWSVGVRSTLSIFRKISDAENYPIPEKNKTISIVSSLEKRRSGHRKRVAFVSALMSHYGGEIDYYGRWLNPVQDKLEAIAPYKYHIAIENSSLENYWTEKLADAWVGWSLPIYYGDPSILDKVPDPRGIEVIDINDPKSAMRKIDNILSGDIYSSRLDAIAACREWAIKKSNVCERICEIIESSEEAVLNKPSLEHAETIRKMTFHPTLGEMLEHAVSSCVTGAFHKWNVKRKYKNITRSKEMTRK